MSGGSGPGFVRPALTPIWSNRALSSQQTPEQRESGTLLETFDAATLCLEFDNFSFWPSRPAVFEVSVWTFLQEKYQAVDWHLYGDIFLILGRLDDIELEHTYPFSIGNTIAFWRIADDFSFCPVPREYGFRRNLHIDPEISSQIVASRTLPPEVFRYLADVVFTDSIAISYFGNHLVVELAHTGVVHHDWHSELDEYYARLSELPESIEGAGIQLAFHNGPINIIERRREMRDYVGGADLLKCRYVKTLLASGETVLERQESRGLLYFWDRAIPGVSHSRYTVYLDTSEQYERWVEDQPDARGIAEMR
ncbi:hypothetical protein G7046_g442 [Stylonectria norvegica]|nr:hypothetical protein G7046_g442 [Stylonectria norvegica]